MRERIKMVFTGGAWAGKTSLAEALARDGVHLVPEAAIHVIGELTRELGLAEQADWRLRNPVEFQRRVARTQLSWERRAERTPQAAGAVHEVVVCDRGIPDGLAFLRVAGSGVPADLLELARAASYHAVWVLDTLADFEPRRESGRTDDRQSSLAVRDALLEVYAELGHRPVLVPNLPLEARLAWIRREWQRLGYPGSPWPRVGSGGR